MGQAGLGRGRRPFVLEEVTALGLEREEQLYTRSTDTVRSVDLHYTGAEVVARLPYQADTIRVLFETPVNLKDRGKTASRPDFHIFFRQAMRRISSLAYFHHGRPLEADYVGLVERSRQIKLVENHTVAMSIERFSRRQGRRIPMGGYLAASPIGADSRSFFPGWPWAKRSTWGKTPSSGWGSTGCMLYLFRKKVASLKAAHLKLEKGISATCTKGLTSTS